MVDFIGSRTRANLLRAFAGESQARNRYTYAAGKAKQLKLHVLEATFQFTADQEKEHAEIFWKLMKGAAGESLTIEAGYPIYDPPQPLDMLREAQKNEFEEHQNIYPAFARVACEEGFQDVAYSFEAIARIEQTHGERFQRFADMMEADKLFKDGAQTHWMCLNCGHIHTGPEAPMSCPVCSHDQGYFIRTGLVPFN